MSLELQSNQSAIAKLSLKDSTTGEIIANADFSEVTAVSDNESVVIASVDPDGVTPRAKAVSAGTANILVTAKISWTNNLGAARTATFQYTTPVTVTSVATEDGTELIVEFGIPFLS